jgi:7-cyano-7-deazaguanine synthase
LSDNSSKPAAVCIVSGGLDSVCYTASLASDYDIYMITFGYGQRATREIERACYFTKVLKAKDHKVVDISFMKSLYGKSNALTDSDQRLTEEFEQSLVVPLRNAIFITIATAWAMSINARVVAYGAHTGDIPHYPDCRPVFVRAINEALNIAESDNIIAGRHPEIKILSPAITDINKALLLRSGYKVLGDKVFQTWSCYSDGIRLGNHGDYLHCGRCESCISRKKAFTNAQIEDRTLYAPTTKYGAGELNSEIKRDIHKH